MQIIRRNEIEFEIELSLEQLLVIRQSLGEVCSGFRVVDFEEKIGDEKFTRLELERFRRIFDESEHKGSPLVLLANAGQIAIYRNAIRETCLEIDEWGFSTRIAGLPKKLAEDVLANLEKA